MEVFIGNLSAKAKLIDIHNILGEFEMHSDFSTHEGKSCHHSVYHFVVVTTKNKKDAEKLIRRLNGYDFAGYPLDVREYMTRNIIQKNQWKGKERRISEQLDLAL